MKTAAHFLDQLLSPFPDVRDTFASFQEVTRENVPEPQRSLLAHEHHMTVTLEEHYGSSVVLQPLSVRSEGDSYSRTLLLRAQSSRAVVMVGVMRVRLEFCSDAVRKAIVEEATPLGRILIENNVLRRIQLDALLRFGQAEALRALFESTEEAGSPIYGRTARIFCDEKPAIELLEIVAPARSP